MERLSSISDSIRWADEPGNDGRDIAIFVVGTSGVGKSTFINVLLQEWKMEVGNDMVSCTHEPEAAELHYKPLSWYPELKKRRLLVVDMPAFDHTHLSDDVVFQRMIKWSLDHDVAFGGFIYLIDITSQRLLRNAGLRDLINLCGRHNATKLVFGTTWWEYGPVASLEEREAILKRHLRDITGRDLDVLRFLKTTASAHQFIQAILQENFPVRQASFLNPSNIILTPGDKQTNPLNIPTYRDKDSKKEIVIPIMGATGAGKSSFINKVLGKEEMQVSKATNSCTQELATAYVDDLTLRGHKHLSGYRLALVDTPGFDDTQTADVEILERIAKWLEKSYRDQTIIGGVIYLQDITPTRMTGTARRNLQILRGLCGKRALDRVVILTTMWGKLRDEDIADAEAREEELKTTHFNSMIDKGSRVFRFDYESISAWAIIDSLLNTLLLDDTVATILRIQEELAKENKLIPETEAGQALRATLQDVLTFQQKYSNILGTMQPDEQVMKDLQEALVKINRLTSQLEQLKVPISRKLRNILHKFLKKFSTLSV